eukprot:TRINITY_DN14172_c0_g1_i1.p1 TRINITY_DN14172_c0_g1~~TRINITY_DN14172_c0_g1_i1.p1  ORF type:complete len:640 (-),score=152.07 TRINITY_DN14172_c0_g1_i1:38-1888(-)
MAESADDISNLIRKVSGAYQTQFSRQVSDSLIAFIIRAVVLEHPDTFSLTKQLQDQDVRLLVKYCVDKLADPDSPALATIALQVAFDEEYVAQQQQLESAVSEHTTATEALLSDIVAAHPRGTAASEALYRKVLAYAASVANVSSSDISAMRAAAAALESVLPRGEIGAVAAMTTKTKTAQLQELAGIVSGILLFNMATKRGSAHVEDVVDVSDVLIQELLSILTSQLDDVARAISDITLVINHAYSAGVQPPGGHERLQQELALRRQYEHYLKTLESDTSEINNRVQQNAEEFKQSITDLGESLSSAASVPADTVYPRFVSLAAIWRALYSDTQLLRARRGMLTALLEHRPPPPPIASELIQAAATALGSSGDKQTFSARSVGEAAATAGASRESRDVAEYLDRTMTNVQQLPLELNGFCPWTIVQRNKMLFKGNRNYGLVRYRGKHYAFASSDALDAFLREPQRILDSLFAVVRKAPELITLLNLQSVFGSLPRLDHYAPSLSDDLGVSVDAECQTLLHVVEKNLDNQYEWSEWALRRRALQLANLRNKATHSTQTGQSHFRRENETQTYLPKQSTTQTAIHTGTNPPRRKNYIRGLRGAPEQKVTVVKLELDL